MPRTGILVTGFGGPDSIEACGPFMCNLMGREPSDDLVKRVELRYLTIGGASPLPQLAGAIASGLEERLAGRAPVVVGMRYWHPYIADAMRVLVESGVDRVVTLSLSPFESKVATGAYREAVLDAAAALGGVEIVEAPHVGDDPLFSAILVDLAKDAFTDLAERGAKKPFAVFTAHSLPLEDLEEDDPYVSGLNRTAAGLARMLGLADPAREQMAGFLSGVETLGTLDGPMPWAFCYQSKGNRPGGWLGPAVEDVVAAALAAGHDGIAACPIGFMTDHMETLYDLDVDLADMVLSADAEFSRAAAPNDRIDMIAVLADIVSPLLK